MSRLTSRERDFASVIAEVEARGAHVRLRPNGIDVTPAGKLTPELRAGLRAIGRRLVARPQMPAGQSPVACELFWFPDWNSSVSVRLCAEHGHQHRARDGEVVFQRRELELVRAWAQAHPCEAAQVAARNALLDLKLALGGGLVASFDDENRKGPAP